MSRTAMVVLAIVALTLGAVLFIVNRAPSAAPTTPQFFLVASALDPITPRDTDVSITIRAPEQPEQRLEPTEMGFGGPAWTLEREGVRWPVAPDKPGALLRAIADAQRTDTAPQLADEAITVEFATPNDTVTIRVAPTPLSGNVAIESSNGFHGHAAPALLDLLLDPGPVAWRVSDPFPGFPPATATRLFILPTPTPSGDNSIELARLDGRWRVIRPIAARANPTVVEQALSRLGSYTITQLLPPEDPSVRRRGWVPALSLEFSRGSGSSGDAESRWIEFASTAASPIVVRLGAPYAALATLTGPPPTSFSTAVRSYLATTATDARPEDVSAIKLQWTSGAERTLERALDAWVEKPADTPADTEAINDALRFLASEPGEPQESFSETDIRPLLRVELLGFDGGPLDVLSVGYNADAVLTVRGQNVVWLFGRYRGPALFDLPAFADLEAPREDPPPAEPAAGFPSK